MNIDIWKKKPSKKELVDIIKIEKEEIERLHSIIKEVRENIKENWQGNYFVRYDDNVYKLCDETLEILDKENK